MSKITQLLPEKQPISAKKNTQFLLQKYPILAKIVKVLLKNTQLLAKNTELLPKKAIRGITYPILGKKLNSCQKIPNSRQKC